MKKVYLTIDDGPSIHRKQKVDICFKNDIQPIWFSVGTDMERKVEDTVYTIKKGGIIGNHSYDHPRFSEISVDACCEQIDKANRLIEIMYERAEVQRPTKIFRFPYMDKGIKASFFDPKYTSKEKERIDAIQGFLKEQGYCYPDFPGITYNYYQKIRELHHVDWGWTYDAMEWCTFQKVSAYGIRSLDDVIELMDLHLPERGAGLNYLDSEELIILHDHPETTGMFEAIIKGLLNKNLIFQKIPLQR